MVKRVSVTFYVCYHNNTEMNMGCLWMSVYRGWGNLENHDAGMSPGGIHSCEQRAVGAMGIGRLLVESCRAHMSKFRVQWWESLLTGRKLWSQVVGPLPTTGF